MKRRKSGGGERGIALVMALLVLLVLSLLAVVLMTTVGVETKIAGHGQRESAALNTAEAGIAEAISRIRSQEINFGPNPRAVAQIFNCASGSVPFLGVDSTALATAQPAGSWLSYSTATRSPAALTVTYKTNAARTQIYRYDPTQNPPVQTGSGSPIFVITATGREGADTRTVVTEVIQKPVNLNLKGALTVGNGLKFAGNCVVCGYNHRADTPVGTGYKGRIMVGGCDEDSTVQHWETGLGDLTGAWCANIINPGGGSIQNGNPATAQNQIGFYNGPWEALGMSQAEFYSMMGPSTATPPGVPNGLIYLDNNSTPQDQSGSWGYGGVTGSGLLYVDGDLTLNSSFNYSGLIYVEGDLKINGQAWVLGSLIVKGRSALTTMANGGATILYSSDAVIQALKKYSGGFVTLAWREV